LILFAIQKPNARTGNNYVLDPLGKTYSTDSPSGMVRSVIAPLGGSIRFFFWAEKR